MTGSGGAVTSVDRDASQVGIDVLAKGGNAADAAVATAAALGVTEPYSAGIGGGGFLVYYDARTHKVRTIDGRETAPKTFTPTTFTKPDGTAMDFNTVVSSGLSVGVPGTPALWDLAARDFGTRRLADLLAPAERLARTGFTVDQTYHDQTAQNADRFAKFPATAKVFLPGGKPPAVGSVFTNPDMAKAYAELRRKGVNALYQGELGADLVAEARAPHTADGVSVMGGQITRADLADYSALKKAPVHSTYEGLDVYGMPVPSSGGIAVAEILNLMRDYELRTGTKTSEVEQRRLPAPVQRGLRDGVRRPQPLRRRRARRAGRGADQQGLRGRALLPVRPRQGRSRGRSRSARPTAATPPARRAPRRRVSRARACPRRTSPRPTSGATWRRTR